MVGPTRTELTNGGHFVVKNKQKLKISSRNTENPKLYLVSVYTLFHFTKHLNPSSIILARSV